MTYAKALVALGLAALTALGTAIADGHLSGAEIVGIVIAAVTAIGVYVTPNKVEGAPPRDFR